MQTTSTEQREDAIGDSDGEVVVGRPMARLAPPTRTSPELHTEMEKNAIAVSSDRKDPMTRPCTPRCADEDTALLVPFRGPNSAIGARIVAPSPSPSRVADSVSRNEQPEDDREAAEHDGGDGVGATEHRAEQVERTGGPLRVGIGSTPCVRPR